MQPIEALPQVILGSPPLFPPPPLPNTPQTRQMSASYTSAQFDKAVEIMYVRSVLLARHHVQSAFRLTLSSAASSPRTDPSSPPRTTSSSYVAFRSVGTALWFRSTVGWGEGTMLMSLAFGWAVLRTLQAGQGG